MTLKLKIWHLFIIVTAYIVKKLCSTLTFKMYIYEFSIIWLDWHASSFLISKRVRLKLICKNYLNFLTLNFMIVLRVKYVMASQVEGIGWSLVGHHQTGLVRRWCLIETRPVWCGGSIWVSPDRSGEKVMANSHQTGLLWCEYFGHTRLI